ANDDGARLRILRDSKAETLVLTTDLDRLSQVFINLVSNARKYCDAADPELAIRVAQTTDSLAIDFVDNGSGVSPEAQDLIFEKFARVSDRQAGGAGLGLAISRQIVTRLGGEITYLAGHPGAAFRVILPRAIAMAAQ
ncbi:MAG TPA: ATP-binding protein, partial [Paracoccaceae bacterium]|nr:ATP-binding protein [Paracoccaceae bacterium]